MRKFLYVGLLSFLMFCNNTETTVKPHDLDATDLDDSVTAHTIDSPDVKKPPKNDSTFFKND